MDSTEYVKFLGVIIDENPSFIPQTEKVIMAKYVHAIHKKCNIYISLNSILFLFYLWRLLLLEAIYKSNVNQTKKLGIMIIFSAIP